MHDYSDEELVAKLQSQAWAQIESSVRLGYFEADHLQGMVFANVSSRRWGQGAVLAAFGDRIPTLAHIDSTKDEELLGGHFVGARKVARFRAHVEALRPVLIECERIEEQYLGRNGRQPI